ncbi:hypothetical protein JCM1393_29780 [Clostridium carnis]
MRGKKNIKIFCILFSFIYIFYNFYGCTAKENNKNPISQLNTSYVDKSIHKDCLSLIEYTDKFSLEDTLINNIIMLDYNMNIQTSDFNNLLDILSSKLNNELNNVSSENNSPELLLSNIYFYIIFSNKINVAPTMEIKNKISNFINTQYIDQWDNLRSKDKLILLNILEKISFIGDSLDINMEFNNFILHSLDSIQINDNNIDFENETILFYKIKIFKNMHLKDEINKIQPLVNDAVNNLLENLNDNFVDNIQNIPLLSMLFDNIIVNDKLSSNNKLSRISNKVLILIESNIDIPAVIKFYCFNIIKSSNHDTEMLKDIVATYPRDTNYTFTAPAELIPTFKSFYFFINLASMENNKFDVSKSPINEYTNILLTKYRKNDIDFSEIYYFLKIKNYIKKNPNFDYIENKVNDSIKQLSLESANQENNFTTLYWKLKILLLLNNTDTAIKLEPNFSKIYELNKASYEEDDEFLIAELMYYEVLSDIYQNTDNIDLNLIGQKLLNYDNDFYVRCANMYFNIANSHKIKIDDNLINDLSNKLLSYKTIYGYSASTQYKSINLEATFEGYETESLIETINKF